MTGISGGREEAARYRCYGKHILAYMSQEIYIRALFLPLLYSVTLVKSPCPSEPPTSPSTTKKLDFMASKNLSDFFNILEIYQEGEKVGLVGRGVDICAAAWYTSGAKEHN